MNESLSSDQRVELTPEQAIAMLPDGDSIHTFRNPRPNMLAGADWPRAKLEDAIRASERRELSGSMATHMGHGLAIKHDGWLFIATREGATT